MRHPYRTVPLVVAAVVLLTGCSYSYPIQLLLTVKNADDGKPVEGVTGVLDTLAVEERKQDLDYGSSFSNRTNADGLLTHEFTAGNTDHKGPWYLKLQKDGFEPLVIAIRPSPVPKSGEQTPVPVTVEMKPLPKKP
jgi:hypothetical protein